MNENRNRIIAKLNAYRNLILAVAALITAIGSWFRPTDTTATKMSFEWTSDKLEKLSTNDVKNHEDVVALKAYMEGYIESSRLLQERMVGIIDEQSRKIMELSAQSNTGRTAKSTRIEEIPSEIVQSERVPKAPTLKAAPKALRKPDFERDILKK